MNAVAADIDLIAIERVAHGTLPASALSPEEKRYAAAVLAAEGRTTNAIAVLLHAAHQTVAEWRQHPRFAVAAESTRWRDRALCREIGPDLFLPPDEDDPIPLYSTARARAVCTRCPVRDACLDDAMAREGNAARRDRAGVWGGLSAGQRAALARARRKEPGAVLRESA